MRAINMPATFITRSSFITIVIGIFLCAANIDANIAYIEVDTTRILSKTSPVSFGCVGVDWWPTSKCDYGRCAWGKASILNLDLDNKILRNAISSLSPVFIRLGGSLADFVRYEEVEEDYKQNATHIRNSNMTRSRNISPNQCVPFSQPTNDTRIGYELGTGCLTMKRWDELNGFCLKANNCNLLFDLNALIGRKNGTCPLGTNCHIQDASKKHPCCTNWTGSWDSENAEYLLRYTKKHFQDNVYGFEFGNELVGPAGIEATLTVEQYVDDFCKLFHLINEIWNDVESRPKLITPDTAFEAEQYGNFIKLTNERKCYPDIITWHQYLLGAGVDPKVSERAMAPSTLDKQIKNGILVNQTIMSNVKTFVPEIWIGEAGGAYNSGRHLVTDAFMSSFWYLDGFGILSEHNHKTFCRQTLIGGNYGLLNTTTFEPNPDYYALLLWQRLMGINVFNVNVSIENYNRQKDKEVSSYLRAYAHCTNTGSNNNAVIGKQEPGLTILLINLSNETEFFINISDYMYHERIEYVMDSTDLHSQSVYLNNKLLKTNALNGDIPNMDGKVVKPLKTIINGARNSLNDNDVIKTATDNLIHLKPSSYGFFTFPTLDVEHCQ